MSTHNIFSERNILPGYPSYLDYAYISKECLHIILVIFSNIYKTEKKKDKSITPVKRRYPDNIFLTSP